MQNSADWTREKITINAGYGDEHLAMFLFLPKSAHPRFETLVFFPIARVNTMTQPSGESVARRSFICGCYSTDIRISVSTLPASSIRRCMAGSNSVQREPRRETSVHPQ